MNKNKIKKLKLNLKKITTLILLFNQYFIIPSFNINEVFLENRKH